MGSTPRLSRQGLILLREFLAAGAEELAGSEILKRTGLSSGTLYPLLMRFETAGLLKSRWEDADPRAVGRPRRRFYLLTGHGATVAREALRPFQPVSELAPGWGAA